MLPGLRPNSLVSIGKLADAGYTTIFHPARQGVTVHQKKSVHIRLLRKPVLQGWQDENGLWGLSREPIAPILVRKTTKQEAASNLYSLPSILQAIKYLHAAAGFPTKDKWVKAIKNGDFVSWPGLTVDAVNKHFSESIETQQGHMKKQRQNVRSTKQKQIVKETSEDKVLTKAVAKHNILVKVLIAHNTVYSDQTGCLPVQSNRGNCFLMVFYDVDSNYINVEPMKNHQDNSMIQAYQNLWAWTMQNQNKKPTMHILGNKASVAFKAAIKTNCNLQLVPPDTH